MYSAVEPYRDLSDIRQEKNANGVRDHGYKIYRFGVMIRK